VGNATTASIDTTTIADGTYTLQATATSGGTTVTSEPRTIYVLNGTETGNVQFSGLTPGQTLNGTANVNLTATYAPIPFTQIRVSITDSTGAAVSSFSTGNVGTAMAFGWDTTRHPNGSYTLSVVGLAGTQTTQASTATVTIQN
jgi:hypothetical protein